MTDTEEAEDHAATADALSVEALNRRIASVVGDADALEHVRCVGEVTDLSRSETALYFSVTDGECELPCLIWANRYEDMEVDLSDGDEVLLEGAVDYWVEGGKLDLKPWSVNVVGEGDQAAAVERLRDELEARGWFDDDHKRSPPLFPDRVGVVTSLQGDARYDVQNAIHAQDPTVDVVVKDATVQGPDAPTSLANGIHHLDRSADVDAIIVGRGGGSDSDLQAFNTEAVAEAIFTANTPVLTAIGHTADELIADQVADDAAITPTAAGEYVVASRDSFVAGTLEPLAEQLDAAFEGFEQAQKHEAELEQAVDEASAAEEAPPTYYKVAIAVLLLLLLLVTALWLGVL